MLYGLGAYDTMQTLKLDVEHIEDASNLERLGVTALTSLSLNVNKLTSLQTIGTLKKLERLSLRDNRLTSLEGMKMMQR
jgi:Leucine-rich repeat (LRR) protein